MDGSFWADLACPIDRSALAVGDDRAICAAHGHEFPLVEGVPVLLRDDVEQTIGLARASLARARDVPGAIDERCPDLHLESLGIGDAEKTIAIALFDGERRPVDPVAAVLIAATNGMAYRGALGSLPRYPIPDLRLPAANGETLLDIGCSWGRWSIAAARKGYAVTGIDPSLGALVAAKRISRSMGLDLRLVCADARHLPFREGSFATAFSYSVLQHFSRADARRTLSEVSRVLAPGGVSLVQMPNVLGVRSLMHQARRGFSEGEGFAVRYWSLPDLMRTFSELIGPTDASVHCYFGLGLEPSDTDLMSPAVRRLTRASEWLRAAATAFPPLIHLADSVYLKSEKAFTERREPAPGDPAPSAR